MYLHYPSPYLKVHTALRVCSKVTLRVVSSRSKIKWMGVRYPYLIYLFLLLLFFVINIFFIFGCKLVFNKVDSSERSW